MSNRPLSHDYDFDDGWEESFREFLGAIQRNYPLDIQSVIEKRRRMAMTSATWHEAQANLAMDAGDHDDAARHLKMVERAMSAAESAAALFNEINR